MSLYSISEDQIIGIFQKEPIDIWINSFGGCRSNFVRDLIKDKYRTYNTAYEYKACHYIKPLDVNVGSGIFCYVEDVGTALTSQLNRNMTHNFEKLNDDNSTFSIKTWLDKINQQIDNWTSLSYFPVVIINTDKLEENSSLFEEVYEVEFKGYKPRKTSEYHKDLLPYIELIEQINNKLKTLPNFTLVK